MEVNRDTSPGDSGETEEEILEAERDHGDKEASSGSFLKNEDEFVINEAC